MNTTPLHRHCFAAVAMAAVSIGVVLIGSGLRPWACAGMTAGLLGNQLTPVRLAEPAASRNRLLAEL
jgi:hypothetical protein